MSAMPPLIRSLGVRDLLSFGPASEPIELGPLNVLIGPNGSGKSNVLEVIGILRSTPGDFGGPLLTSGGGMSGSGMAQIPILIDWQN